jgi:hypothetical protein
MVSPIESVIKNFLSLGVYDVILFAFISALFYGVLRKSKILGDSAVLNGIVAIGVAFLFLGYPIITGAPSLLANIVTFFTQVSIIAIIFLISFLIASFFYPNLTEMLTKTFTHRTTLFALVALGFILFLISGVAEILWQPMLKPPSPSSTNIPKNITLFIAGISVFIFMLIIAASVVRGE